MAFPNNESSQKLGVMLSTAARGGIRAVVEGYERDGLCRRWNVCTINSHVEGTLTRRLLTAFISMRKFLALLLAKRVSFVHCHVAMRGSFWRKCIFAGFARLFNAPVIFHLHGSEMKSFYSSQWYFVRLLIAWQLAHVHYVIVLSQSWCDFVKAVAPKANVRIIANYVLVPPISDCHQPHEGVRVIFLGVLGERKGVFDLLKVVSEISHLLPTMEVFIGGNGEIDKAIEAVRQYGLESKVKILGWVSGEDKRTLLASGDIFVLPSYNEGLPVSILEAMSWQIPVISTNVGGIPQLVRDGVDGILINPGDLSALSQALLRLGQDGEYRENLGRSARFRVESSFSKETVIPQIEEIYQEFYFGAEKGDQGLARSSQEVRVK
jgi:glycosyltransferase involved in cell wall biosynthesis